MNKTPLPWSIAGTALLLLLVIGGGLAGTAARARAAPPSYEELVGRAKAAADQDQYAECERLYGQAIKAVPADSTAEDIDNLRENRSVCRRHIAAPPPAAEVAMGRLPTTVAPLIGRQSELKELDQSWQGPRRRHVIAVVALGGQGKTTLVVNWLLHSLAPMRYRGARRVFGWSFYRQGASEDHAASADEFFAVALKFFGDPDPSRGSPFEKSDRLVELVRKERSLLVLDGLEPLQYAPGAEQGEGRLTDRALASLLSNLALENPGLVVVTSRAKLTDLAAYEGGFLRTIELQPFSVPDGITLLRRLHVQGTDDELAAAVQDFKGHPLALTLLGNLLVEARGGEVSQRTLVGPVVYADAKGGQARRAMAAYDRWFGAGPERALLRLLGLFDRPAPAPALAALRAEPQIPGLNEGLAKLTDLEWNQKLARLRRAGLVAEVNDADKAEVDAHPLIRDHFGEALRKENEAAWREGHRRLYEWYAGSAKPLPDTAEEMAPLYAAVLHGCRAGLYQEAFDQVFKKRIRRFKEHYSIKRLGAFGADLSVLSGFFAEPWMRPVAVLRESDRALLLNEVGYALRALGRLEEAVGPMQASLAACLAQKDWSNGARGASNLSELQLLLGQLKEATESARQAVKLADQSGDAFLRLARRTDLADALHQGGQTEQAVSLFVEAETMQRELQPEFPLLYSLRGYQYCDLLLARGATDDVRRRAEQVLQWRIPEDSLISIGLEHLCLGRAQLARLTAGHPEATVPARDHLNQAVSRLREAGDQAYLAHSLIHRAALFRHSRDFPSAHRDLDEALRLTRRGHMLLYETDAHLERARLLLAQKNPQPARAELTQAQALITQTGYARRAPEAAALAQQLTGK